MSKLFMNHYNKYEQLIIKCRSSFWLKQNYKLNITKKPQNLIYLIQKYKLFLRDIYI